MKDNASGRFAGFTLLAGLLAASILSLLPRFSAAQAPPPPPVARVRPTPPVRMKIPAMTIEVTATPLKSSAQCIEPTQIQKARERAVAYALIHQESPVADGGDDAGLFKQAKANTVNTECGGETSI